MSIYMSGWIKIACYVLVIAFVSIAQCAENEDTNKVFYTLAIFITATMAMYF